MLTLKLELWPKGDESRAKEIGRIYLANIGGSADRGDYSVAACRRGTKEVPREIITDSLSQYLDEDKPLKIKGPKATRHGRVDNFPRKSYNVWRLVFRALKVMFPEEKI